MSFTKKNVIQEFMKDDYIPTSEQFLVKYCSGKGNNLHEVECVDGSILLASMPKKYRHTVWLKKDDCLVIDPIEEGKKVKGEIVCVLPKSAVRDLIVNRQWPAESSTSAAVDTESLLNFFTSGSEQKQRDDLDTYPPSESSSEEDDDDDDDDEKEEDDGQGENDAKENSEDLTETTNENKDNNQSNDANMTTDVDDTIRDRNRSRVQLVTSGVVTVTNIITEGLENDIQSLEFEADEEESSDELSSSSRDAERHANTIRIQVNYKNANSCSGASGD